MVPYSIFVFSDVYLFSMSFFIFSLLMVYFVFVVVVGLLCRAYNTTLCFFYKNIIHYTSFICFEANLLVLFVNVCIIVF
jgi:hypothetical protein